MLNTTLEKLIAAQPARAYLGAPGGGAVGSRRRRGRDTPADRVYAKVSPVQAGELTFSSDIAYARSPAASRASSKEA
jgi:hypothetical protein